MSTVTDQKEIRTELYFTLRALREKQIDIESALDMFRAHKREADSMLLSFATASSTFPELAGPMPSDRDSFPWRFAELCWQYWGPRECLLTCFFGSSICRPGLVDFVAYKLSSDEIDIDYTTMCELRQRYPGLAHVIDERLTRRAAETAVKLRSQPTEMHEDAREVSKYVQTYGFPPDLAACLEKVDGTMTKRGDGFDQAAQLKHLRSFLEHLHRECVVRVQIAKPETKDNTRLENFGHTRDFLARNDVITSRFKDLAKGVYAVLSDEGVHALKGEAEYVRLCRNIVVEYALILFTELDRFLESP